MDLPNFPVASHSYFRIANLKEQYDEFIGSGAKSNPTFKYGTSFSNVVIARRLKKVSDNSLDLVSAGLNLQSKTVTKKDLNHFRFINAAKYGNPRSDYVNAILSRVESAVDSETKDLWQYISQACSYKSDNNEKTSIWPSPQLFNMIKGYGQKYMVDLVRADYKIGLHGVFNLIIKSTGLASDGWVLCSRDDDSSAHVTHKNKRITVGSNYRPRNIRATYRIVAHEIYGHALRGPQDDLKESEGFAILLEQLLDKKFKPRRMFRYLAAALGWGTTTDSMDFCAVYEIIWRSMVILSKYSEIDAKRHAFSECARVFRGGRPDIPGAVYLKDTLYFSANMLFWQEFEKSTISYNDFMEIANGSKKVLS
ncbi:DUF1704 domain-containing protein [Candidatus Nomurabacteria bacterium]|nr:DUF1704 domain-containing protein [Candidatus Nomurabacteria bacterium]